MKDLDRILRQLECYTNYIVKFAKLNKVVVPRKKTPHGSDWFNDYVHG